MEEWKIGKDGKHDFEGATLRKRDFAPISEIKLPPITIELLLNYNKLQLNCESLGFSGYYFKLKHIY